MLGGASWGRCSVGDRSGLGGRDGGGCKQVLPEGRGCARLAVRVGRGRGPARRPVDPNQRLTAAAIADRAAAIAASPAALRGTSAVAPSPADQRRRLAG